MRHLSFGDLIAMLDYAQIHIFDAVINCDRYILGPFIMHHPPLNVHTYYTS